MSIDTGRFPGPHMPAGSVLRIGVSGAGGPLRDGELHSISHSGCLPTSSWAKTKKLSRQQHKSFLSAVETFPAFLPESVRASERLSSSKCIFHLTQRQASPSSTPPPVILCFCSGLLLLSRVIKPATRARGLVPQWRALPVKRLQRQSAVVWSLMSRVCVKMYFSMKSVKVHKACISATEPIQDLLCKIGRNASFLIYHIFRAVWFV